ncbi:MAG: hypothetical protein Q8M29_10690 [Bacteroidota bacterium]|nr:hypothetical protein [Bacteroidota bacterium]
MDNTIDRLTYSYSNARKSWETWCFLVNLDLKTTNDKILKYVENNELLQHFRFLSFKDFHIELYKILKDSRNNQDNIFRLLRDIPNTDERKNNTDKRLAELTEHLEFINKLLDTRDKYYAHLDKDYEKHIKEGRTVNDIYYLFQCVEQAIIALTSLEYLTSHLDKIPSRDEFTLNTYDCEKIQ